MEKQVKNTKFFVFNKTKFLTILLNKERHTIQMTATLTHSTSTERVKRINNFGQTEPVGAHGVAG